MGLSVLYGLHISFYNWKLCSHCLISNCCTIFNFGCYLSKHCHCCHSKFTKYWFNKYRIIKQLLVGLLCSIISHNCKCCRNCLFISKCCLISSLYLMCYWILSFWRCLLYNDQLCQVISFNNLCKC